MPQFVSYDEYKEHAHRGYDGTSPVTIRSFVSKDLTSTAPQTATNYGIFFVATRTCVVKAISEVHTVAGNDAGAVTLQVERLRGTEALDAGDTLLSTAFNLKGTANTVQQGTLVTTGRVVALAVGDRLALKDAGTLTTLQGVCVTIELEYA